MFWFMKQEASLRNSHAFVRFWNKYKLEKRIVLVQKRVDKVDIGRPGLPHPFGLRVRCLWGSSGRLNCSVTRRPQLVLSLPFLVKTLGSMA